MAASIAGQEPAASAVVTVVSHPLCAVRLGILRDHAASNASFRAALKDITQFLLYEATRELSTETVDVRTPLGLAQAQVVSREPLFVPVLRAGLGMVDQAHMLIPEARIGFIGLARNEHTLEPELYFDSLPEDLTGVSVFVLDPMLATGGSIVSTVDLLVARGASEVTVICVLASVEGVALVRAHAGVARLFVAAIDEELTPDGFIYPGLGDAGDRQFGRK